MKRKAFTLGIFASLFCPAIAPMPAAAQNAQPAAQTADDDPFIWLEDVDGKRSMDWVNAHNAATVAELSSTALSAARDTHQNDPRLPR